MSIVSKIKIALQEQEWIYYILYPIHRARRRLFMRFIQKRRGIDPVKVVFSSFQGRSYSDNPRYISERLHELRPDCDIVWLFDSDFIDDVATPDYVRKETLISRKGLIEQATARFWVDNFMRAESLYLNDRAQYYINTWHGDRGFKKVGDDNEKLGRARVYRLESRCAMMIAGSKFGERTYRTALHFEGEVLMDGCPRNDILMRDDPSEAAAIRGKLGIPADTGILMYAPTYRDPDKAAHVRQHSTLDVTRTLDHLEKRTGRRWVCLYRAHYLSAGLDVAGDDRVRDASGWPEMAELLLVTDVLITDYSSCGGDFALLGRPLFLFQPDAADYLENSRSFYFRMEDSPFLIAHSQPELERLIDETDDAAARANCEALARFFGVTETGHAADAVCRYIMARM